MLQAILHGKAGRVCIENSDNQRWRDVFKKREDLLTATFFGRIRYLSRSGEFQVLAALIGDGLASELGEIREVVYWPKLKGLDDRQYVEPDLIIQFDNSVLIVEVKPPFGGDQDDLQWERQIRSLFANMCLLEMDLPKDFGVHFLALGQNILDGKEAAARLLQKYASEGLKSISVCEWDKMFSHVKKLMHSEVGRDAVIYQDWLEAFYLFGIGEKPRPYTELIQYGFEPYPSWCEVMSRSFGGDQINSHCKNTWFDLFCYCKNIDVSKGDALWKF